MKAKIEAPDNKVAASDLSISASKERREGALGSGEAICSLFAAHERNIVPDECPLETPNQMSAARIDLGAAAIEYVAAPIGYVEAPID